MINYSKQKALSACVLLIFILAASNSVQALSRGVKIRDQQGKQLGLYSESHALVIGVSNYTAGWPGLPGVEEDIRAVESILNKHGFNVSLVRNPNYEELNKAFTDFINKFGRKLNNRLLFYFAGHGHTLKQSYGGEMGYIVPSDAPNPNRDADGFMNKAIDMQQIEVFAKRIQSKHALFLFDSCFSGSIFSLSRAVPANISYKTCKPVRQFITSGSADEQVPDTSIFRKQFIAALNSEGDLDEDGYITATELGEFLQSKVVNYSKGSQHPQYGKIRNPMLDKGDFVFIIQKDKYIQENKDNSYTGSASRSAIDVEEEFWKIISKSNQADDFKTYLKEYPYGRFAALARLKINQLEKVRKAYDISISNNEIKDFVNEYLLIHNRGNINEIMVLYADKTEYFSEGIVDKNFIRNDKIHYYKRWSVVKNSLKHDIIVKDTPDKNIQLLIFDINFDIYSPKRNSGVSGTATNTLKVRKKDGKLKIVYERQDIINKVKTSR